MFGLSSHAAAAILFGIGTVIYVVHDVIKSKRHEKRIAEFRKFAQDNDLAYEETDQVLPLEYEFKIERDVIGNKYENFLADDKENISYATCDFTFYETSDYREARPFKLTLCILISKEILFPDFYMREEKSFWDNLMGYQDIDFSSDKEFSDKYLLQGPDEEEIISFFDENLRSIFLKNHKKGYFYEAHGDSFIVAVPGFMTPEKRLEFQNDILCNYLELIEKKEGNGTNE